VTLKRLDLALAAFFRRVKEGQETRVSAIQGLRLTPGANWRNGKLRLSGIGRINAWGEARTPGWDVCCGSMREADRWFMSLVVACEPHRECGDLEAGLDWGVETFATLAYGPGEYDAFANDRLLNSEQEALRTKQRRVSDALRGKRSRRALKARRALARRHRKVASARTRSTR